MCPVLQFTHHIALALVLRGLAVLPSLQCQCFLGLQEQPAHNCSQRMKLAREYADDYYCVVCDNVLILTNFSIITSSFFPPLKSYMTGAVAEFQANWQYVTGFCWLLPRRFFFERTSELFLLDGILKQLYIRCFLVEFISLNMIFFFQFKSIKFKQQQDFLKTFLILLGIFFSKAILSPYGYDTTFAKFLQNLVV